MNSCAGAGPHGGSLSDLHMQIVIFVSPFVSVCLVSGVPSSCNPRMNPVARSLPARNHPLNSHTNFVFTKATKLVSQFRVAVLQSSIHFWYDSWQEALCVCVVSVVLATCCVLTTSPAFIFACVGSVLSPGHVAKTSKHRDIRRNITNSWYTPRHTKAAIWFSALQLAFLTCNHQDTAASAKSTTNMYEY